MNSELDFDDKIAIEELEQNKSRETCITCTKTLGSCDGLGGCERKLCLDSHNGIYMKECFICNAKYCFHCKDNCFENGPNENNLLDVCIECIGNSEGDILNMISISIESFLKYYYKMGSQLSDSYIENNCLKEEIKLLKEEILELNLELNYRPGGPKALEAQQHFEDLAKTL
jgi:hypothetical protein